MDEYGVLSGYEDGLDEDDDKGSRAVPSRTSLGSEAAFIEKFPSYGGYRWGIRNFTYRCLLTLPEIEVMSADTPHTLYKRGAMGGGSKPTESDIEEATRLTLEAQKRKEERRRREAGQYTIEEVFAGKADADAETKDKNE